ncbi:phosphate ABC transporter permease [Candidatus Tenderia electrophaga]|jgi:phosphate transport system permease protein|uniref:Phosphate transport system permease protein PstA n=1 Tax=Candidatus Tenderia electrophaga TaxID=1748243 RepID=A0A0S2TEK5_9GAMM|nr:phosphate ABC transporter permease [Candidatus Tenderia electrophaga]
MRKWINSGSPWVWLTAASVSISIIMVVGLLLLIAARGLGHFWPADVESFTYQNDNGQIVQVAGEIRDSEEVPAARITDSGIELDSDAEWITRYLIKTGNRDLYGIDFRWLIAPRIQQWSQADDMMVIERREWGNFYGFLKQVKRDGEVIAEGPGSWDTLQQQIEHTGETFAAIRDIEKGDIGAINYAMEQLRLERRGLELEGEDSPEALARLEREKEKLQAEYEHLQDDLQALYRELNRASLTAATVDGRTVEIPIAKTVQAYRPNSMSVLDKVGFYIGKLWEFVSEEPREANTEGGIFPAIFGTVMMVMIMSVLVTPFGVIAAIYLREYAKQGPIIRMVRIAVNNLAGVPSIVYGVFGLGFFVYFLGGNIDQLFFAEAAPAPTFGTPGLLWASITLALLTVPVVIVATEEGLSRIPKSIREGSLALGATKAETLWRTIIPMTSPAIMTGLILAVARAAGEVAPLMLVGVVKLAPTLPLDGNFPFLHLDRKFMHLGFHIYDVGFQSPNVEAARPLVYATALLLVLVIIVLNLAAIAIRNRLREKYKSLEQ